MRTRRIKAYLVHAYTASALVLLLLSAALLIGEEYEPSLAILLLTVVIDSTDGMLARRYDVKTAAPEFDGRRLDDVIDYVAYVFLPVLFLLKTDMLAHPAILWGAFPLVASAFGFSRVDAKLDEEGFFLGFPSYWNIVAFYAFMLGLPPWLNTAIVVLLAGLVFVPTRYIYITRLVHLRRLNYALSVVWAATITGVFLSEGRLRLTLLVLSLGFPFYYTASSLLLDRRSRQRSAKASRAGPDLPGSSTGRDTTITRAKRDN